jgi:hypothetical protein
LVLANPNFGKSPREVQPIPGADQQPYEGELRETDWSEATSAVCVPPDVTYYVDQFADSRTGGGVEVVAVRWTKDDGKFEFREMTVNQGQVISSKGRTEIATSDFVVDFTGGYRKLPEVADVDEILPAEMLVVNESGELVVRSELADEDPLSVIQIRRPSARDRDQPEETGTQPATDFSGNVFGSP